MASIFKPCGIVVLASFTFLGIAYSQEADSPQAAAAYLPDTVVVYAELSSPADVAKQVLEHPLRNRVESIPALQQVLQSNQFVPVRAGVSIFEAGMGMRWPKTLAAVTSGGAYFAIDGESDGVLALLKARDTEVLDHLCDTVFSAIRGGNLKGSENDPIRQGEYRGITAYSIRDDVRVAQLNRWLLITNKAQLGKRVIDLYVDGDGQSLANKTSFATAYANRARDAAAWAFVNVHQIRESGVAEDLYSGRTDNAIAELLFGGIMSTLQQTTHSTATFSMTPEQLTLRLESPFENSWAGEDRAYYFGEDGKARAPRLLQVEQQVLALSSYRDISQMWLRAGDLMTEKANDDLAKADTQLTTFFSGRDFGEDILGAFTPDVQLIVAQQDFENVLPRPAIKLPAFALRFQMKTPEETRPELRRVFQSFIGFLNVVGAMNGQPQFDLGLETTDRELIVSATYVPDQDERESTSAPINFNFSPTVAFAGDQLIIASTDRLARSIAQSDLETARAKSNTVATLDAHSLQVILSDNRQQLVAQNMLEKGHSQSEAEAEIGLLLELLDLFQGAKLDLNTSDDTLQLGLSVQLQTSN